MLHHLVCHLQDVLNVLNLLHPLDGDCRQSKLCSEAGADEDGAVAAVAAGHHVVAHAGLEGGRT